jgi:hypothetical protein
MHNHNSDNIVEKIMLKKPELKPKYIPMSKIFKNVKKDIKIKVKANDPLEKYGKTSYDNKFAQIDFSKHHKY